MQIVSSPLGLLVVAFVIAPVLCLAEIHITTQRNDVRDLKQHASVTLVCRSTGRHADWTHNGHPVSNTSGRFYIAEVQTSTDGLVSRLTIVSAQPEDAGTYVCACHHSSNSDNITVTVAGLGHESHRHVMIDGPRGVEKVIGSHLELTCKADIHSSVEWLLNGKRLTDSTKDATISTKEDERGNEKTILLIRKSLTAADDFGLYSCRNLHDSDDEATVNVTSVTSTSLSSSSGFRSNAMETTGLVMLVILQKMTAMLQ